MAPNHSTQSHPQPLAGKKYFSVEEANKALNYVSRIVEDIRGSYRLAVAIQKRMEYPRPEENLPRLKEDYDRTIGRLNNCVDELNHVGVELKDYEMGLIDFPALHESREICLCWRRGEKQVNAWHEVDAGFAGRQDVTTLPKSR